MICYQCKNKININTTIYKGFDCEFCSRDCRLKFISTLKSKNCNLINYKEWSPDKQKKIIYTWDIDSKKKDEILKPPNINVSNINNLEIKEECKNYIKLVKSNKDENDEKDEKVKIYEHYKTFNTIDIFNSIYDISYNNIKEYVLNAYEYTSKYFK